MVRPGVDNGYQLIGLEISRSKTQAYRAVEVLAWGHVEDSSTDGKVDGFIAFAIVLEESCWCESAEDDGWGSLREGDGCLGPKLHVDQNCEERQEDEVNGGRD
jgi:hypothetical protein